MSSIPETLTKAAEVIEERGWHQGGYAPGGRDTDLRTCPVCVLAAINVAVGLEPDTDLYAMSGQEATVQAAMTFARHLGLGPLDPTDPTDLVDALGEHWNDEVAQDAEQVTTALRECAAELSKETTR